MILLHAAPVYWNTISGLAAVVPQHVAAQNRLGGVDAALAVTVSGAGQSPKLPYPVFTRESLLRRGAPFNLPEPFNKPDLVVFHGIYIYAHTTIAQRLHVAKVPYLVCPHGSLATRALARNKWKKRLGNVLFFNRLVAHAAALHCLTPGEARQAERWGRQAFVVGNGMDLPPERELARPGTSPPWRLVFLGRLDARHKGLDLLVDACGRIRSELLRRGARVELYGPDQYGSGRLLADRIDRLGLKDVVRLCGPVTGQAKRAVLASADVFLHTSRWEGHPVAILEALAHGVPCLLTRETNMAEEVASAGAGWHVGSSPSQIAAGLKRVLQSDPRLLEQAGTMARKLAEQRYTWQQVARDTVEAYRRFARNNNMRKGNMTMTHPVHTTAARPVAPDAEVARLVEHLRKLAVERNAQWEESLCRRKKDELTHSNAYRESESRQWAGRQQSSIVNHQSSIINHQSSIINHQSSDALPDTPATQGNVKWYAVTRRSKQYLADWIAENARGCVFLDFACGAGKNTIQAAESGAALAIGIDLSGVGLDLGRREAAARGLDRRTFFLQGDCEQTGLPDGSVDAVLCSGVLHHLDLEAALPEIRRILKPGGKCLAVEAFRYNPLIRLYRRLTPHYRTRWEEEHILGYREIKLARRFFEVGRLRYWHFFSLAAIAFRNTPLFRLLLTGGDLLDRALLRVFPICLLAWQVTFEMTKAQDAAAARRRAA